MAKKTDTPPAKTTAAKNKPASGKPKTGSTKSSAAVKRTAKTAPAKSSRTPSKSTASSTKGAKAPAASRRTRSPAARSAPSAEPRPSRLTPDRKLDIIGILLALVGFLTILSLLSPNNSSLVGGWVSLLEQTFGWGVSLFAVVLVISGVWMVLRNFERIPRFSFLRALGLGLLFFNILAWLHFLAVLLNRGESGFDLAAAGEGGGYIGAAIGEALRAFMGLGLVGVALLAWTFIALALSLDVSVLDLFRWVPSLAGRLQDSLIEMSEGWRTRRGQPPAPSGEPLPLSLPGTQALPGATVVAVTPAIVLGAGPQQPGALVAWQLPPVDQILDDGGEVIFDDQVDLDRAHIIEETLASFGSPARVVEINRGPTITQFGVEPDFIETRGGRLRVRVGKIASLADDLALALSARTIRVQAPVPGKSFVGIEVPNEQVALVSLRDLLESDALKRLKSPLRFALGQNVSGAAVAADLTAMPHLLIAGQTGSGKSVCVNALICCLLINNTPDDLRLIMVDPKRVELTGYNGIPHLLAPVVVELERVVAALQWVSREMDMRYQKLADLGARNILDYNARAIAAGQRKLPYLVVIIDELADLMMLAPDETERTITRLAQLSRATGIHLVLATQRPSVDVVTGLIKANFPARIAFAVASGVDSRVILDQPGAERLLGRGDMLFQAPDAPAAVRLQGAFVSDIEIQRLVAYWQSFAGLAMPAHTAAGGIPDALPSGVPYKQMPMWDDMAPVDTDQDPLFNEAVDLARRQGRASISMLQRRLRIGYTRAARLIESMEEKGIVGPPEPGSGAREILDYGQAAPPVDEA
jgi:S-DNA-T family DNA segregation ATPase FtsK/SpoIIIE